MLVRLGWGQEGSMTQQHPRCARRPEVEDRELMSIQELKMLMMRMTETQRVWGCQCAETALPRPGSQEKRGPGLPAQRAGEGVALCVPVVCILEKET